MTTEPAPFFVIVGSETPQQFSPAHITRELARPAVRDSLAVINCHDSGDVLSCYIADEEDLKRYVSDYRTNSDYFPVIEFCTEHRIAGFDAMRRFFDTVRTGSVYEHIDWTGISESEKARWLERFAKTYDAATYVLLAESTPGYLDRLEHSVAGLGIAPENAALKLTKRKAEHALLAEGLKSIHAGNAGPARSIAERMLATDPDSAIGWMLRAQVARAGGNLALAKAAAQRAVDIAPENLGAHFNLWAVLVSAQAAGIWHLRFGIRH
jgi:hypothetical protein